MLDMPATKTSMERTNQNESEVRIEREKMLRALDRTRKRIACAEDTRVQVTELLIKGVHLLERVNGKRTEEREKEQKILRLLRKSLHCDCR
jgi:hypothetical protein